MTPDVQFLLLLAVIALLFITELIPLAVTSIGGAVACGLLGFITPKAVFSGLSNSSVLLFAGMFVVGAAMFHTGLAQNIGKKSSLGIRDQRKKPDAGYHDHRRCPVRFFV